MGRSSLREERRRELALALERVLARVGVADAGARDLFSVLQVLGADEADDAVQQERLVATGEAVGAGLHRHLVGAVVGVRRQRRALTGLEVHDVRALRRALAAGEVVRLVEQRDGDAEVLVRALAAGDGLEHQVEGRAALHGLHLRGDVGEHAVLRRHAHAAHQVLDRLQDVGGLVDVVGGGVDADDGVAVAKRQPVLDRGEDAVDVVTRVVADARGCAPVAIGV